MRRLDAQICFGKHFTADLIVSDIDGNVEFERPMHSFTNNFLQHLRKSIFSSATSSAQDTRVITDAEGNIIPINATYDRLLFQSTNQENPYHGIILGTGNPVRSPDMLAMGSALGTDSIEYVVAGGYSVTPTFAQSTGGTIIISKAYKNISGAKLDITEIGLSHYHQSTYALFSHDIYNPSVELLANQTKRFSIRINIPAGLHRNFYTMLAVLFNGHTDASWSITSLSNTPRPVLNNNYGLNIQIVNTKYSFQDISSYSILGLKLGSSSTAGSPAMLTSVCTNAQNTSIPDVQQSGNTTYLQFVNTFINEDSANSVDVNQIGIVVGRVNSTHSLLAIRYVLPQTLTVSPLQQIEVHFKIKTVFQ